MTPPINPNPVPAPLSQTDETPDLGNETLIPYTQAAHVLQKKLSLISWQPLSRSFNPEFTGYTAAPGTTDRPQDGWVLYSRGEGGCWNQRTLREYAPEPNAHPQRFVDGWWWVVDAPSVSDGGSSTASGASSQGPSSSSKAADEEIAEESAREILWRIDNSNPEAVDIAESILAAITKAKAAEPLVRITKATGVFAEVLKDKAADLGKPEWKVQMVPEGVELRIGEERMFFDRSHADRIVSLVIRHNASLGKPEAEKASEEKEVVLDSVKATGRMERGLTPLNDAQWMLIKEWSADHPHIDGDMWGNDEARAINLTTFARSILNAAYPSSPSNVAGADQVNDTLARRIAKSVMRLASPDSSVILHEESVYHRVLRLLARSSLLSDSVEKTGFRAVELASSESPGRMTNHWGDRFWGVCKGDGQNHLGKVLMRVRQRFQAKATSVGRGTDEQPAAPVNPEPFSPASKAEDEQLLFRSAASSLWYSNPNAAGTIDRVKVGEVQFAFSGEPDAPSDRVEHVLTEAAHVLILRDADNGRVMFYMDSYEAAKQHLDRVMERAANIGYTGKIYRITEVRGPVDHLARTFVGPRTLDAKWLDPECWEGCQSLTLKAQLREGVGGRNQDRTQLWRQHLSFRR